MAASPQPVPIAASSYDPAPPLPSNIEAERSVLGAIILDNAKLPTVADILSFDDFFVLNHREIFSLMRRLAAKSIPIDLVTLTEEAMRNGSIDRIGGPAYVAQLIDGVPRINNVEHYAGIVARHSRLRKIIYAASQIRDKAFEMEADPDALASELGRSVPELAGRSRLRSLTGEALLQLVIPERPMLLHPILPSQGLVMIYSRRGVGKTYLSLAIAQAVASGGAFLNWNATSASEVVYVDGELPLMTLQKRLRAIAGHTPAGLENLKFITPDAQDGPMPDLASSLGQQAVETQLGAARLLILDNLSALVRTGDENEAGYWLPVGQWGLRLRQRGLSVLFVHHAGKNGTQRGTSRKEDLLDTVITLKHPSDYSPADGLRAEIHYEKCRGFFGEDASPIEVSLQAEPIDGQVWTWKPLVDGQRERVKALAAEGLTVREISEETGIPRSTVGRLRKGLP